MKAFYSDHYELPLPAGHRFPISKYARLRQRVIEGCASVTVQEASPASKEQLLRVHHEDYIERMRAGLMSPAEMRVIGFPWSPAIFERSIRSSGGTLHALRTAVAEKVAVNLAGGTHHAFAGHGAGFCIFNDSVIAARELIVSGLTQRVLVIDLDVHQGDGTASLTRDDPTIYTFSIHGANSYPVRKELSDLDVPLKDGTNDEEYLSALAMYLPHAFEESRPTSAIYLAGADPFLFDRFGRLSLTKEGLQARDRYVLKFCSDHGIPVAVTMAGGYARDIEDTVDIQFDTVRSAESLWLLENPPKTTATTGFEVGKHSFTD